MLQINQVTLFTKKIIQVFNPIHHRLTGFKNVLTNTVFIRAEGFQFVYQLYSILKRYEILSFILNDLIENLFTPKIKSYSRKKLNSIGFNVCIRDI